MIAYATPPRIRYLASMGTRRAIPTQKRSFTLAIAFAIQRGNAHMIQRAVVEHATVVEACTHLDYVPSAVAD